MYHCKVRVCIFSENMAFSAALSACPSPERFAYTVCQKAVYTPEDEAEADLVIWDLPQPPPFASSWKQNGVIVLCRDKTQIAAMKESDFANAGELWEKPLTTPYIQYRFQKLQKALKQSKDFGLTQKWLDTTIDSIPDLVWYKDVIGAHLKVNNAFCQTVGKTKEQVEGRGHYYIWDLKQEEYEKGEYVCLETEEEVLRRKETCLFDEKVKGKMGLRQFKTYKSPIFDDDGEVIGTVGIAHDVTVLENMTTELDIILGSLPFAVLITDIEGRIVEANQRFENFFKIKSEKISGRAYKDWKLETFGVDAKHTPGDVCVEFSGTGELRTLEIIEEPIRDVFGTDVGYFYIYRDVTIERAYEHQMLHNANTDFLTGLYNRRYFTQYVEANRGKGLGILYLDLDNFKYVNDTYGHPVGDRALAIAAQALRRTCPNDLIARVGGDEFLVAAWDNTGEKSLGVKAEEILNGIKESFAHAEYFKTLSTSVGGALAEPEAGDLEESIRRADVALYMAKGMGKDCYCLYNTSMEGRGDELRRPNDTADTAESQNKA